MNSASRLAVLHQFAEFTTRGLGLETDGVRLRIWKVSLATPADFEWVRANATVLIELVQWLNGGAPNEITHKTLEAELDAGDLTPRAATVVALMLGHGWQGGENG